MLEGFRRGLQEFEGILFNLDGTLADLRDNADYFEAFKKLAFAIFLQILFLLAFLLSFGVFVFFSQLTGFGKTSLLNWLVPLVYGSVWVIFYKYPIYFAVWLFSLFFSFSFARFFGGRQSFKQAFAHWCYFYYFGFAIYFLIAFFHEGFVTPLASSLSYYLFVIAMTLLIPFLIYLTTYSVRINNKFSHKKAFAIQTISLGFTVILAFLFFYLWFHEPITEIVLRIKQSSYQLT